VSLRDSLKQVGRTEKLAVTTVFVVALLLRLLWLAYALPDRDKVMDPDSVLYLMIAENIMAGNGVATSLPDPDRDGEIAIQPTAKRTPGYPFFCGVIMRCLSAVTGRPFAEAYAGVLFVQALLDSITAILVFLLARQLAGWPAGLVAGLGHAVNYYVIQSSGQIMTEALFTFVQVAALLVLFSIEKEESPSLGKMAAVGALMGLGALIRPLILLFPALIAGWVLVSQGRAWRRRVLAVILMLAVFGAVLLPWATRNRVVLGKWVPGSTIGGYTFFYSSHVESKGNWAPFPTPDEAKGLSEVELDDYFYRKGWEFVSMHPGTGIVNAVRKALRLYYVFYPQYDYFFGVIFLLALPGVWFYYRGGGRNWWLPLLVLYTTAICAVYLGHPRYRIPIVPCFLVYMGHYVATYVWKPTEGRARRPHAIYCSVVLVLNLVVALSSETIRTLIKSIIG